MSTTRQNVIAGRDVLEKVRKNKKFTNTSLSIYISYTRYLVQQYVVCISYAYDISVSSYAPKETTAYECTASKMKPQTGEAQGPHFSIFNNIGEETAQFFHLALSSFAVFYFHERMRVASFDVV